MKKRTRRTAKDDSFLAALHRFRKAKPWDDAARRLPTRESR